MAAVLPVIRCDMKRIDELLTPEEREQLRADLAEMANQRRRAEAAAANWILP